MFLQVSGSVFRMFQFRKLQLVIRTVYCQSRVRFRVLGLFGFSVLGFMSLGCRI